MVKSDGAGWCQLCNITHIFKSTHRTKQTRAIPDFYFATLRLNTYTTRAKCYAAKKSSSNISGNLWPAPHIVNYLRPHVANISKLKVFWRGSSDVANAPVHHRWGLINCRDASVVIQLTAAGYQSREPNPRTRDQVAWYSAVITYVAKDVSELITWPKQKQT